MNKLRKPRPSESPGPMSRTMLLAVSGMKTEEQRKGPLAAPHTRVEQYWATRALVAETLLSARDRRQADLADEIRATLDAHDRRQRRSEQVMVLCLAILLGFMAWLVTTTAPAKGSSHFTIPILSPFASVVEHETGVFGTKAVVVSLVVVGVALYAKLKYYR